MFSFLLFFLCFIQLKAQQRIAVEKLIENKIQNFIQVDTTLQGIKHDKEKLLAFLTEAEKSGYTYGMAYAENALGILARNKAEYPEALARHEKALILAKKSGSVDIQIMALNMFGVVYRRKDEMRLAIEYHKKALELAESNVTSSETNERSIAVARNSIGNIYLTLKQDDLAEQEFLKSIEIESKLGNKLGLAINYQNLGGIYEERGDLDTALNYYQKSLSYNEQINSDIGRIICKNSIGQIYLKENHPREALRLIQPTIAKAEEIGDRYYVIMAKMNLGWALYEIGELDNAESYIQEALEGAKVRNVRYYIAESYSLLSKISEAKGNYKAALNYNRLYHENEEQYLNERNRQYLADLILKYESDKKKNQIEILEKENELVNLKLEDNNKIIAILVICTVLLGIIFYILYHQSMLRREKAFLALEQKMMRSQMNPHFIFNSLNSIKLYIINNDKDKAVYYLNKFSKLIRTILSNSKEKDITLADELATMGLYMNIENIRFSNKIRFDIQVEEGLQTENIRIPSLILQPFLENSIWHGLSSKEGDKCLSLRVFQETQDLLTIEIEDNGVGRARSTEIKSKKTLNNKSIGIDLTDERLKNYFSESATGHMLEIIDLYDDNGEASGTKVVLKMPIRSEFTRKPNQRDLVSA